MFCLLANKKQTNKKDLLLLRQANFLMGGEIIFIHLQNSCTELMYNTEDQEKNFKKPKNKQKTNQRNKHSQNSCITLKTKKTQEKTYRNQKGGGNEWRKKKIRIKIQFSRFLER